MSYWLNVDIPTKAATLHTDMSPCTDARRETEYKGKKKLKRDGGWLRFESEAAAQAWLARELGSGFDLVKCDRCY